MTATQCLPTAHAQLFWHQHNFENTDLARVRASNGLVVCAAGGQYLGVAAVVGGAGALLRQAVWSSERCERSLKVLGLKKCNTGLFDSNGFVFQTVFSVRNYVSYSLKAYRLRV